MAKTYALQNEEILSVLQRIYALIKVLNAYMSGINGGEIGKGDVS